MIHSDLEAYGVTHPSTKRILVSVHYDKEQAVKAALEHWKQRGESPTSSRLETRVLSHLRNVTGGRPGVKAL